MNQTDATKNRILYKYLTVLGKCYSTGYFEELFPLLAEDAVMESQWVLSANTGKAVVMDYYTGKGHTFRKNHCCPKCEIVQFVGSLNPVKPDHLVVNGEAAYGAISVFYPEGKLAIFMSQQLENCTNSAIIDLTLDDNDMIARIDICMPELFQFVRIDEEELEEKLEEQELESLTDVEIEQRISDMLRNNPNDFDALQDFMDKVDYRYGGDLEDFTFREAIRKGNKHYVQNYAENFDLNDGGGYSTYLYETEDPEVQEILMDCGAFRSWEDYDDCRFAMETINGEILAFDPDFQKEVFEKYLEVNDLAEADVVKILSADRSDDDEINPDIDIEADMEALGAEVKDNRIDFKCMSCEGGYSAKELIESLGWDCDFEGDAWKLETLGVYFIR